VAHSADIGLIGLAVMGQNLVLNMNERGFTVAVYNRTRERTRRVPRRSRGG
jgi:6-phosphogluconate dehydrogenase